MCKLPRLLPPADAEAVCTAIRTPDCERMEKCSPKVLQASYGDKATCIRRQVAECKAAFILPGVKISVDQGKACGARVAARACDSTEPMPECVFRGTIADNGPCISRDECASAYCEGGSSSSCGKCKPMPPPKPGAPDGAACKQDADCNPWAQCDGGKCASAGKKKGGKCNQDESCVFVAGLACQNLYCSEIASLAEPGQPCRGDEKARTTPICKLSRCDRGLNKCVAQAAEGQPCKNQNDCQQDLVCDASKKCSTIVVDTSVCWK